MPTSRGRGGLIPFFLRCNLPAKRCNFPVCPGYQVLIVEQQAGRPGGWPRLNSEKRRRGGVETTRHLLKQKGGCSPSSPNEAWLGVKKCTNTISTLFSITRS